MAERVHRALEPGREEMRELLNLAADRIIEHVASLPTQRASDTRNEAETASLVREPMPETGAPYEGILDLLFDRLIPKGFNTASGGALSYVTGGGLFHSAVADLIAGATNRYVAYWGASPGLAEMEHVVLRWFSDMLGYPASAGGVLLTGGSTANLSALITARRNMLGDDFARGTIYTSDQVHHSIRKAVVLAGFPESALRIVPSDGAYRMRVDGLQTMVANDRRAGMKPFFLAATAGTTNTGAVDDLCALGKVAKEAGLWFHVDASYGGFFALTDRGKAALSGIDAADTVVLDPHKSLFLPFGTGCLLAREVTKLRQAHLLHSDYIHAAVALGEDAGAFNFGDLSAEMSRDVRGLRIWLPMKLLGAATFRACLDEKIDLAALATAELRKIEGVEVVAAPQLSIVAFRVTASDATPEASDARNRRVMDFVNEKGRVHLSATILDGRFTLRICVLSFRTHEPTIRACIEDLAEAVQHA